MYILYECAACVLVALIGATLAVTACAIFLFLKEGRGIMERTGHQLVHGASWLLGAGLAATPREL
jgi:hypothetical protein